MDIITQNLSSSPGDCPRGTAVRASCPYRSAEPQAQDSGDRYIPIPLDWTPPKYHFGQLVQQGWIYGMRYYPSYSTLYDEGSGWSYEVIIDWKSQDYHLIAEEQIRPYDPKEAAKKLNHEIDNLHIRATALEQQLNRLVA